MSSRLRHLKKILDPTIAEPKFYIDVRLAAQRLSLIRDGEIFQSYLISSSKNGPGEQMHSECTPTGWHRIRAKIGVDMPLMTVFSGRRPTGEIYSQTLESQFPNRDWILTRILWLSGLEPGRNRFGQVDTAKRYIYIHGSPDHLVTGLPNSHGCIRMKNADIYALFDQVEPDTCVLIS